MSCVTKDKCDISDKSEGSMTHDVRIEWNGTVWGIPLPYQDVRVMAPVPFHHSYPLMLVGSQKDKNEIPSLFPIRPYYTTDHPKILHPPQTLSNWIFQAKPLGTSRKSSVMPALIIWLQFWHDSLWSWWSIMTWHIHEHLDGSRWQFKTQLPFHSIFLILTLSTWSCGQSCTWQIWVLMFVAKLYHMPSFASHLVLQIGL